MSTGSLPSDGPAVVRKHDQHIRVEDMPLLTGELDQTRPPQRTDRLPPFHPSDGLVFGRQAVGQLLDRPNLEDVAERSDHRRSMPKV